MLSMASMNVLQEYGLYYPYKPGILEGIEDVKSHLSSSGLPLKRKGRAVRQAINSLVFYQTVNHRRPEGGGNLGQFPPPLEFENDDVICCFRGNYPKIFARTFGTRIKYI